MKKSQLPSYTTYSDTGIRWLDKLPQHWDLKRLKEVSDIQNSNVDKNSYEHEVPVRLCNYVDVYKNEFISSSLNFMQATADESEIRKFALAKDDVLITKDSETFEDIAVSALVTENIEGVICGYHLAQIKAKNKFLLGSYLFRLFQSKQYGFRFSIHAKGFTRFGLGQSAINDALTPIPPLPEQQAIADYLDTKTAQIDRKIDLLEQKAEKYTDLKQSLINETVTRGLDKTVPMKDSGVEWIGQVPVHWEVKRLKEVASIQNSNVDKKSHEHEVNVRLCNYVDVYKNEFIDSSLNFMKATADESEIRRFSIKKNDVLITKDSETFDDIAVPALAIETMEDVICGYHLAQIRTKAKTLFGAYLFRLFQSKKYGFRFLINAKGITRVGLGQSAITDALTPIPPLTEQEAIVEYLSTKTIQIDRVIEIIYAEIEKLKELRKTLINDVVTGKIKVTGETIHE